MESDIEENQQFVKNWYEPRKAMGWGSGLKTQVEVKA